MKLTKHPTNEFKLNVEFSNCFGRENFISWLESGRLEELWADDYHNCKFRAIGYGERMSKDKFNPDYNRDPFVSPEKKIYDPRVFCKDCVWLRTSMARTSPYTPDLVKHFKCHSPKNQRDPISGEVHAMPCHIKNSNSNCKDFQSGPNDYHEPIQQPRKPRK